MTMQSDITLSAGAVTVIVVGLIAMLSALVLWICRKYKDHREFKAESSNANLLANSSTSISTSGGKYNSGAAVQWDGPSTQSTIDSKSWKRQSARSSLSQCSRTSTTSSKFGKDQEMGSLTFTFSYRSDKHLLCIHIDQGHDVDLADARDLNSAQFCFVRVRLSPGPSQKIKTKSTPWNNGNPGFNYEVTFEGIESVKLEILRTHFTLILVMPSSNEEIVLGEATCPLSELLEGTPVVGNKEIQRTITKPIRRVKKSACHGEKGEILLGLSYDPSKNTLCVKIVKAKDLPNLETTGNPGDPFISLQVFINGTLFLQKRTQTKPRTQRPVFNESFLIELPAKLTMELLLGSLELHFQVLHSCTTATEDQIVLGCLDIGQEHCFDVAKKFWIECLKNPGKQATAWLPVS